MTDFSDLPLKGPIANAHSGKATSLLVMLHGVGADGNDLFGLVPHLAPHLPDTAFASPDAPQAYDMAPFGRQWFSLMDRTPAIMLAGIEASAPILVRYLDELSRKFSLSYDRIVLLGFSQGTMMSLYVAPRLDQKLAGVIGFSGRLVAAERLADETKSKPEILLIHGAEDDVVPPESLELAETALKAAGFTVQTDMRPNLGHGIDGPGLGRALAFIQKNLNG